MSAEEYRAALANRPRSITPEMLAEVRQAAARDGACEVAGYARFSFLRAARAALYTLFLSAVFLVLVLGAVVVVEMLG